MKVLTFGLAPKFGLRFDDEETLLDEDGDVLAESDEAMDVAALMTTSSDINGGTNAGCGFVELAVVEVEACLSTGLSPLLVETKTLGSSLLSSSGLLGTT